METSYSRKVGQLNDQQKHKLGELSTHHAEKLVTAHMCFGEEEPAKLFFLSHISHKSKIRNQKLVGGRMFLVSEPNHTIPHTST